MAKSSKKTDNVAKALKKFSPRQRSLIKDICGDIKVSYLVGLPENATIDETVEAIKEYTLVTVEEELC